MKKLIIIAFLFTLTVNAQIQLAEDYSFKRDKQYHAIAGTVISATMFTIVYNKTGDVCLANRAGWMSACTAGFLKEFADGVMGKEMMLGDMLYTTVFGIATSYTFKGIVRIRENKRAKKIKERFDISFVPVLRDSPLIKK